MNLKKKSMLSERSGTPKSTSCGIPLGDTEIGGCLGLVGWEEWAVAANGYTVAFGMMEVF